MLHSFLVMFHRYVSNIQVFKRRYAQTGQVGIRPNAGPFFICPYCIVLLLFCYRFEGLCRLPSSGFMNIYMYKLVIVVFLLSFSGPGYCIGSAKGQAKLK